MTVTCWYMLFFHSWRSWRSRPVLTAFRWHPCPSAHQTWWHEPSSRSPCSATARPTSTSTAPRRTCPLPPPWTSTTAPSPSTGFIRTPGITVRSRTPGTVNWRSWWGTARCRRSPRATPCCRPCLRTAPGATVTLPAPAWRKTSKAVSVVLRTETYVGRRQQTSTTVSTSRCCASSPWHHHIPDYPASSCFNWCLWTVKLSWMALTPSVCRVSSGFFWFFFSVLVTLSQNCSPTVQTLMWCEYDRTVSVSRQLLQPVRTAEAALFIWVFKIFFFFFVWATELYFMSCIFQSEIIIESREKWNASLYCTYQLKIIYLIQSVEQTAASLIPMATYMKKTGKIN